MAEMGRDSNALIKRQASTGPFSQDDHEHLRRNRF